MWAEETNDQINIVQEITMSPHEYSCGGISRLGDLVQDLVLRSCCVYWHSSQDEESNDE